MERVAKIFVAGHRGLVGGAVMRRLAANGGAELLTRARSELDLSDAAATRRFFDAERPTQVVLAAAKVGGILANATQPASFIRENLAIQTSVIDAAFACGVERLRFLGSSCIYPRLAPQPIREDALLTGPLEPTNQAYAVAKIAGIEMCRSYNLQYGTRFLALMPTNLYGPGDNYHPTESHVIPALLRRFHEARVNGDDTVSVWGSGTPRREFLFSDDLADACALLLSLHNERFDALLGDGTRPPLVNVGYGTDVSIAGLAETIAEVVDFSGRIVFDPGKPDGPPRKLLDTSRMTELGWHAGTSLGAGLRVAYRDFLAFLAQGDER